MGFIRHLYAIEHRLRDATRDERYQARQADSLPVLAHLRDWLHETRPKVLAESPLCEALAYLDHHGHGLVRYCDDGRFEIDNNRCENAIRPFVTGRKNWLFAETVRGAKTS